MTYYTKMTDKFMSAWGAARGRRNVLVVECDTFAQACAIEQAARRRSEMTRISVVENRPRSRRGVLYSWKRFSDMGGSWREFYSEQTI